MNENLTMELAKQAHFNSKTYIDIYKDDVSIGDIRGFLMAFAQLVIQAQKTTPTLVGFIPITDQQVKELFYSNIEGTRSKLSWMQLYRETEKILLQKLQITTDEEVKVFSYDEVQLEKYFRGKTSFSAALWLETYRYLEEAVIKRVMEFKQDKLSYPT
jgi:hypothetical protein